MSQIPMLEQPSPRPFLEASRWRQLGNAIWAIMVLQGSCVWSWSNFRSLILGTVGVGLPSAFFLQSGQRAAYELWLFDICLIRLFPILSLITAGRLLRDEIREGTLEYLWTRPVGRAPLLIGIFASGTLLSFLRGLVIGLVMLAVAWWRQTPDLLADAPRLLLALACASVAYSGLAVALSAWSGKYVVLGLLYGLVVEIGISRIPANIHSLAASHHVRLLVAGDDLWLSVLGCLSIGVVGALLGTAIFCMKRYTLGSEKEG